MFSFNLASLKTISSLDDAFQKQLATSWARKCVQGSFNADEILGNVFVNCGMFQRLQSQYQRHRKRGSGQAIVVCGRSLTGKTMSSVGLIAWTQKNFSELPYAYVVANDNLKKGLCQVLVCSEERTDMDIVDVLFAALQPYTKKEISTIEAAKNAEDAAQLAASYCGISLGAIPWFRRQQEQEQTAVGSSKLRYDPQKRNSTLPVLVIDDMVDGDNDNLIRLIYQKAYRLHIFVVIATPSPGHANRLCGLNGKARIGPYHLKNTEWEIDQNQMAVIDWTGTDAWTLEEITNLIKSSFPRIDNSLLANLQQESVTVDEEFFDLRQPHDALMFVKSYLTDPSDVEEVELDNAFRGIDLYEE